jgi:hypothetical protein
MRALLAQWRIEVRWWRGGLPTAASMEGLSGGVCGSTPPFMSLQSICNDGKTMMIALVTVVHLNMQQSVVFFSLFCSPIKSES